MAHAGGRGHVVEGRMMVECRGQGWLRGQTRKTWLADRRNTYMGSMTVEGR